MNKVVYKLSRKTNGEGKSEIIIKLHLNQSRPCFKTGVFIKRECAKDLSYDEFTEFKLPKKSNINKDYREAVAAKESVESQSLRLQRLCQAADSYDKTILTKEWLEKYMQISASLKIEDITYDTLLKEEARLKEQAKESRRKCNRVSLYELAEEYLKKSEFSWDHEKAFRVLLRDLNRFEHYVQKKEDRGFRLHVDKIGYDVIDNFAYYLKHEYDYSLEDPEFFKGLLAKWPIEIGGKHKSPMLKPRGDNTVVKLLRKFRAFYNWMNKEKITLNNPFTNYHIDSERQGEPIYLTVEERDKIAAYDFSSNKRMETLRDLFILHCLIGCRVGDYIKLTNSNVANGILTYMPHKTKDHANSSLARIPLSKTALEILEKYSSDGPNAPLMPFISGQKYNDGIKELLRKCGINRIVSVRNSVTGEYDKVPICDIAASHMCRKTFIGTAYKEVKDPNIICKMSGHVEGSRAFCRYRKIEDDVLTEVIDKIDVNKKSEDIHCTNEDFLSHFSRLSKDEQMAMLSQMQTVLFSQIQ